MTEKIKPNKRLGQNFLINKYTINTLLEIIDISKNDLILEVGPGQGALTREIIKKTRSYIGIEKDSKLCEVLEKKEMLVLKYQPHLYKLKGFFH